MGIYTLGRYTGGHIHPRRYTLWVMHTLRYTLWVMHTLRYTGGYGRHAWYTPVGMGDMPGTHPWVG